MQGIIIASHGDFAKAALETSEMFAGEQEDVVVIGFYPGDSLQVLLDRFTNAEKALAHCDEILVVTDLKGGSPCNAATVMKIQHPGWQVLAGMSVPLLLQLFENRGEDMNLAESIPAALETGRQSLCQIVLE